MSFDPRSIGKPVYEALHELKNLPDQEEVRLKEQKNQAVELYTYLSTWGMLRLKAEEYALSQEGKKQVVRSFFNCLQTIAEEPGLTGEEGLRTLKDLSTDKYLGLTSLGLAIAQEFGFWATAVYYDITGEA
jgi:DNA phosphorothioation-dependent restriction protein DptG